MIPFNKPPEVPEGFEYIRQAIFEEKKTCGDGRFSHACSAWIEEHLGSVRALLTTSGTTSLEMAYRLAGLKPGDEVIMPSFTFTSTATACALTGAVPVFIDVRPDTMNIDETLIEQAITDRTRAIAPVHYAGVGCEMDAIMDVARAHGLYVVEDAAQAFGATYKGRMLGTIGEFGCFSFHETKNYSMGEGGALCLRDERFIDFAEIYREKGTNRSQFLRGQVDKYTWVGEGSSCLPSDMNAAYLYAQLERADEIAADRMATWEFYHAAFADLEAAGRVERPKVPAECAHNAHLYFLKCRDIEDRTAFIQHMADRSIYCAFHYVPLHSAPAGIEFGRFAGEDVYTTAESERLVRLPLFFGLTDAERTTVVEAALDYFERNA